MACSFSIAPNPYFFDPTHQKQILISCSRSGARLKKIVDLPPVSRANVKWQ